MEGIRLLIPEPYIFHFRFDSIKTESVGQRYEYIHGLTQDLIPLVLWHIFDCTAIVQSVGKLDENDSDIIIQCKKDTLEVLGLHTLLLGLVLIVKHCLDLCQAIDKGCNLLSEKALEIINRVIGIFNDIMKKSCNNRLVTKSDIAHYNLGDSYRMQNIRFTRAPSDTLVRFVCKLEGFLNHVKFISFGTPFTYRFFKIRVVACNDLHVML